MVLNYIVVDKDGIEVRLFPQKYKILWSDVLLAEFDQQAKEIPFIILGTQCQIKSVNLRFFDATTIWDLVKLNVSPQALAEDARTNLLKIRQSELERIPMELDFPTQVSFSRWLKIFFLASIVFYFYFSTWAFQSEQWDAFLCFIPMILIRIGFVLYFNQFIQMDLDGIIYKSIFGSYAIRWDEIEKVVMDKESSTIGIWGKQKRLAFFGPFFWSGKNKDKMVQLMFAEFKYHHISPSVERWLCLKFIMPNSKARIKN